MQYTITKDVTKLKKCLSPADIIARVMIIMVRMREEKCVNFLYKTRRQ